MGDAGEDPVTQEVWFSSLEDFTPLTHMLAKTSDCISFYACGKATGEHTVLKKWEKGGCSYLLEKA